MNCEGLDFSGRDIRGCDFSNAKLNGTNFSKAIAGRSEKQITNDALLIRAVAVAVAGAVAVAVEGAGLRAQAYGRSKHLQKVGRLKESTGA